MHEGESMLTSSLKTDDAAPGNDGGGVCARLPSFQKPRPLELRIAPKLKAAKMPRVEVLSRLMLLSLPSSGTPSKGPSRPGTVGSRDGEDCAVIEGRSSSFSRTWRMISASRRNSLSIGAASSHSSALIRPNCLDLGYFEVSEIMTRGRKEHTSKLPRRAVTALRTT